MTTQTTQKTASKTATKTASKAQKTAPVKSTAHGITVAMLESLPAAIGRFLANSFTGHHARMGYITKDKAGAVIATPEGMKNYLNRKGMAHARECLLKGGKSERDGTQYIKAPSGFVTPYIYPFSSLNGNEEGKHDSLAAFGALMLIASGK